MQKGVFNQIEDAFSYLSFSSIRNELKAGFYTTT